MVGPKLKGAWTAYHFVPVLRKSIPAASAINDTIPQAETNSRASDVNESFAPSVNSTSTPVIVKRKYDFSLTDDEGKRVKITKVDPKSIPSEHHETAVFVPREEFTEQKKNDSMTCANDIFKLLVDWKRKHTADLIDKSYDITQLHFMDYGSAMHNSGNYRLAKPTRITK